MRKTTTSLAIFCSAVILAASCGKRGDPLPPLRPFPGSAEGLTVRQVGDRIHLEWRAPVRNTDNTTEKLELAKVEVRRRIVDIPALIEAQTKIIEPETAEEDEEKDDEAGAEEETDEAAEPAVAEPEPEAELPAPEPDTPPESDALPGDETAAVEAEDDALLEPETPPIPMLQIGEFAPDSRHVTTLESTEPGAAMTFEEPIDPTWIGLRIQYAVVYTNRSNRRGPRSASVAIDPVAALVPPGQPTAEAGDGFVKLSWSHPAPDSYFSVFRRPEAAPEFRDTPLNAVPTAEPEHEDRSVRFHVGSCYVIRTVPEPPPPPPPVEDLDPVSTDTLEDQAPVPEPEPEQAPEAEPSNPDEPTIIVPEVPPITPPVRIESDPSPEVCLTPVDTFAPPPPTGLVAVRSGDNVLLTWNEVDRSDVAGYRVYRAPDAAGPFEALTEELVRVPSYTDDTVEAGATYYYAVTSIDDAPAANESVRSGRSAVTFTR